MHIDNRRIGKTLKVHRELTLPALKILNLKIAEHRCVFAVGAFFIIEVDSDCGMRHFAYRDVAKEKIFEQAAAHGIVLKAQTMTESRAIQNAVRGKHIADAA